MPTRQPSSAATRGFGRAALFLQLSGLAIVAADLVGLFLLHFEPKTALMATVEVACPILIMLVAVLATGIWWRTWRQAASEVHGERG